MSEPDPQRILIIKPSSLGDIVHGLPVLAALRRKFPTAHISWLAGRAFAPLLEGLPLLNEVIVFDRAHFGRMWHSPRSFIDFWRFVADVRRRRFDWVIDLQGLFRSGFVAAASGAGMRAGFADSREFAGLFYSRRVRCGPEAEHAVDRNLALARALGLPVDSPAFPLGIRADELTAARAKLARAAGGALESFTAVLPGARWPSKQWPAEHVAEALDLMHARGAPVGVLLGAPDERELAEAIRARCRDARPVSLVGETTLRELTALLSLAERVLCVDSGPMHVAAALGRPLTAVFGPTNPRRTGPYSAGARVVQLQLPCVPCYRRTCPLKHHNCLQTLGAELVVAPALPEAVHSKAGIVRR